MGKNLFTVPTKQNSQTQDIKATAAKLINGTMLRLPAEYFFNEDFTPKPHIFLSHFREHMQNVKSTFTAHHNKERTFTHGTLYKCTHAFVRVDRIKKSPYEGPYLISKKITDRIFKIIVNGKAINILVDRLKPTFIEAIPNEQQQPSYTQPEQTTNLKVYPSKHVNFATISSRVTESM